MKYLRYIIVFPFLSLIFAVFSNSRVLAEDDDIQRLSLKTYLTLKDKTVMDSILASFESSLATSDPRYVNLVVRKVGTSYGAERSNIHRYMDFVIENFDKSTLPYKFLKSALLNIRMEYKDDSIKNLRTHIANAKAELNYALENDSVVNVEIGCLITVLKLGKNYPMIDSLLADFADRAKSRRGNNSEVYLSLLKERANQLDFSNFMDNDTTHKKENYSKILVLDSLLVSLNLNKYGENSGRYHRALRDYGYALSKAPISGYSREESEPVVRKSVEKLGKWVDLTADTLDIKSYANNFPLLSLLSGLADVLKDTVAATKYVEIYNNLHRNAFGPESGEYLTALNRTYRYLPEKDQTGIIDLAIPIAEKLYGKSDERYQNLVVLKSALHEHQRDYRNAIASYESGELVEDMSTGNINGILSSLSSYAESHSRYGNYLKAREYFRKGIDMELGSLVPPDYSYIYINYSGLAQDCHKYNHVDSLIAYTEVLLDRIAGRPALQCQLLTTAAAYTPAAVSAELLKESLDRFPGLRGGNEGLILTFRLMDLNLYNGNYAEARRLLEEGLRLSGEKYPEMARLLYREYECMVRNDAAGAMEANVKLMDYFDKNIPHKEKYIEYISAVYRRAMEALHADETDEMKKAVELHLRLLPSFPDMTTLSGKRFEDTDINLITSSGFLSLPFYSGNDDLTRIPLYAEYFHSVNRPREIVEILKTHLKKNYDIHLNVRPKYILENDYESLVSQSDHFMREMAKWAGKFDDDEINSLAFNTLLASKQLTLTTSDNIRRIVAESGDSTMRENFRRLRDLENEISRKATEGSDIRTLVVQKKAAETSLAIDANQRGNILDGLFTDWQSVANSLGKNDCAVEFASFREHEGSDTYIALVLTPGKAPRSVTLFNSKDIKLKGNVNPDVSIYRKVWLPVLSLAPEAKNIYFSPYGLLHTLGLEYADTDGTHTMSDRFNMYRLSSTRELTIPHRRDLTDAVIFGGLDYDSDIGGPLTSLTKDTDSGTERGLDELREYLLDEDRAGVAYLPGTEKEAEAIESMLAGKYKVIRLEGAQGTEKALKSISGHSPSALHIATHGYYLPAKESSRNRDSGLLGMASNEALAKSDRDMSRSGLLLSGANTTLKGTRNDPDNDGVLTSLEVSSLNLSNTGLVVLSACQTALGEISGEGVFGLQRGFKMAGAGSILMSLWKVNDRATRLLMTRFYENMMQGKSKRESLKEAQNYLRSYHGPSSSDTDDPKKRPFSSPRYWAAFVLLDAL